uniref:Uncharacterized protein n=1 Tax=Oryza glumipatula TaxID=40148 RepID=A0A0E0APT5_9ORYZ
MKSRGTEEGRNRFPPTQTKDVSRSGYFNRDRIVHPGYTTGTINEQFQRKTCFEMRGGKKKKKKKD